jgi:hypothetical protein
VASGGTLLKISAPVVETGTGSQPAWKLAAHSAHQPRELTVPPYRLQPRGRGCKRPVRVGVGAENDKKEKHSHFDWLYCYSLYIILIRFLPAI